METQTTKQLHEVAMERCVKGYSKMLKAKLIAALHNNEKYRKISDYYKLQRKMAVTNSLDSPMPDFQTPNLNRPSQFRILAELGFKFN